MPDWPHPVGPCHACDYGDDNSNEACFGRKQTSSGNRGLGNLSGKCDKVLGRYRKHVGHLTKFVAQSVKKLGGSAKFPGRHKFPIVMLKLRLLELSSPVINMLQ